MHFKKLLLIAFAFTLLFSCKSNKDNIEAQISNLYKFQDYISDVSQGTISSYATVIVVLKEPVATWKDNQELASNLLTVSPKVKGKVVALNNTTIAFVPENAFKQDTKYKFELALADIIKDIPKEFSAFKFKIKTLKQQFNVLTDRIQSHSKEWQYVEGTLRTSDQLDLETAKKLISATQKGKDIAVKFNETPKKGTQFYFTIDSIQRFAEDSELLVKWNGKSFDIDSKGGKGITIPGKNNFTVLDVSVVDSERPYVAINFSDPVKKNQNFNGLVALQGANNLRFAVDGNVLKIFPNQEVKEKGEITLEIFQGIQSTEDYKLKKNVSQQITFQQLKPQIRLLQNGNILPSSNNLKVNFESVNLKAVDVTVIKIYQNNMLQFLQQNNLNGSQNLRAVGRPIARKTIQIQNNLTKNTGKWTANAIDLKELITPEPGAIYRLEFNFSKKYSTYRCEQDDDAEETSEDENFDEEESEFSNWDNYQNYYYYDYDWYERENPCNKSYYYYYKQNKKVSINILASDLGVTIKKGTNHSYFVSANDIVTTDPLAGTKVTFYNFQQQPLGNTITESDGTANFDAENPAYFAIAQRNNQKAYIKLNDGNVLSVSKFDVSGVQLNKGIKGYLYGERGVWRPGDTLFLSFMLNDNANKLPKNHPVTFQLSDPYGKITHKETQTYGKNNFYKFIVSTNKEAPTGNWTAKVSVGGATFSKNLRIETIKPNRLKIKVDFEEDILYSDYIEGNLEVRWLHGAIAKNLSADIQARFSSQTTTFKKFPGYTFDDPSRRFSPEGQTVFDGQIDSEGKASFSLKPELYGEAPGMLKASFFTKVYENGGDFSIDAFSKTYSPYDTYIGLNAPKGDKNRGMLLTDTKHRFDVVSVDEKGKPKATKNLEVNIYKIHWRWWWDTSEDNLSSYDGSNYHESIFDKTISTNSKGKASFTFELKYPDWGRYLVRIKDPKSGHATGKIIYVDWPGWAGKSRKNDPSAATMLTFSTNKQTYNVGEKATVSFPSSATGRALVTVENGTEVIESLWVTPKKGETKFQLPIKDNYTPNVFIHITLLQPHASTANDLPIRLYGVVPISVENPVTKLEPQLTMPNALRPEETVTLKVKEKNGKPMTYSIAIVDEGLLGLTRFKTPNPWETFYAREALGVQTWDVYDDVIGAFGGRIDQIFSIGGDDDGEFDKATSNKNRKANRFKPMVIYLGPFNLKKGKAQAHKVKIPKYIGEVRTMVVAGNPETEAYGSVEKSTPVRKPLMLLASLPRKITPGEKVTLPVTVYAMEKNVKNVTVQLKNDKSFTVIGKSSKKISFSKPDEKMVYFDLEINDFKGIGNIEVVASGNGKKASYQVEIDVVNPNPITTTVTDIVLAPNSEQTINLETFGTKGTNSAQIEFSSLPPMDFNGRMQYLIRYPHGCVEQTTSAAFPQLFLSDVFDLSAQKKKKTEQNVKKAISRLGSFQKSNGGLSYWYGQTAVNDWGTSYAGHFLLEAEKKGYVLPIGFKPKWVRYQQKTARQWRKAASRSDLAQAYRLYTLALAGNADVSSMNRLRETNNISNEAKHRLAAAYALIGQKGAAKQLFNSANGNFKSVKYDEYTYGSTERNRAMALETVLLLDDISKAQDLAKTIAKNLADNRWMSTQSTAYSLLAMAKFAAKIGGKGVNASYTLHGKSEKISTKFSLADRKLVIKDGKNKITLKNNKNTTLFVRVINSGMLPVGKEQLVQRNLTAKMVFKDRSGKLLNVSNLTQGTDFVAEVTISNKKGEGIKDVALMEIFPSGWEIVNTRFTDFGAFAENNVTYTDLRDDRANFYFDLKRYESKTFRILLNASYLGKYYLPGVQCEAMYNNDFMVRTKGQWVEVVK